MKNNITPVKVNPMDIIRIISTFMIMTAHLCPFVLPADNIFKQSVRICVNAVPVFFALSGFLIMFSVSRSSLSAYLTKRFFRIVPLYYSILLIIIFTKDMRVDETGLSWTRYFLFLNNIPAQNGEWVNTCGFWCIPSFIIFYLIAPVIHQYFNSFTKLSVLTALFYVSGKMLFFTHRSSCDIPEYTIWALGNNLTMFLYGSLAYQALKESKKDLFLLVSISIIIVLSALGISLYQLWSVAASAIFILIYDKELPSRLKSCNILYWCAKLSFSIFLVHLLVIGWLNQMAVNSLMYSVLFFALSFGFAFLLYITIERSADKACRKIITFLK